MHESYDNSISLPTFNTDFNFSCSSRHEVDIVTLPEFPCDVELLFMNFLAKGISYRKYLFYEAFAKFK